MSHSIDAVLEQLAEQENIKLQELGRLNFLIREYTGSTYALIKWVINYCEKNDIPLWKEDRFKSLIEDTDRVLKEIDRVTNTYDAFSKHVSDEFLQGSKSDEDLTAPGSP